MKSLLIDTSNRYLVIAAYEDDVLIEGIQEEGSKKQSEYAIPYIERILNKHHFELFDVDEIVVTRGPGSYTGVRVGMTIAKTLKTVHPVEVKMISSLQAYAGTHGKKISVLDARSKKVFVACFEDGKETHPECLMDLTDFETFRQNYLDYEVVGDSHLVGLEMVDVCLYENMHELSKITGSVQSVHELVPTYIKDIEVKQIWHP